MRLAALLLFPLLTFAADLRLGIIGTDTSHAVAFTGILNDPAAAGHVSGARVVAAYKGGSPDIDESRKRVDKFAAELQTKWKIEIVPEIAAMNGKVDGILLTSVDGRVHLSQFRQALALRKPIFIDKPLAATLEDAREIARLAAAAGVPWFSSSSLRFGEIAAKFASAGNAGAITWGPGPLEPHHSLELSWYAIHPIELLYTLMGTGCEEVWMVSAPDADTVVGRWKGGRIGTVRPLRPYGEYGAVVFRPKEILQSDPGMKNDYVGLVREIVRFFETGRPPVSNAETLEIFSFLDAAQRSKAAGGAPMRLR